MLILIVSGVNIGLPLNLTPIWQWCINNRFYSCVLIFFTCNAIEAQLISSGAFEIHFNGKYNRYKFFIDRININIYIDRMDINSA